MDVPDLTIQCCRELFDEVLDSRLRDSYRPFQLSGHPEYFIQPQISRDTLQGMGETLCFAAVPTCKGFTDCRTGRLVFDGKLSQQIAVQALVSGDPLQSRSDVYAPNLRENDFALGTRCPEGHLENLPPMRTGPTGNSCEKRSGINGLRNVVIHSSVQAALDLLGHSVGCHGDDRELLEMRLGAQNLCCGKAVHFGHLQIHQHDVEGEWRNALS